MPKELAYGVYVRAEVKPHHGEGMPPGMKCDVLLYPGTHAPLP